MLQLKPHHFAISVEDLEESVDWYSQKLGFKKVQAFRKDDMEVDVAMMELNGINLEIFCFDKSLELPEYRKSLGSDLKVLGMKHFAFEVDNIEEVFQDLREKDVKFIVEPTVGSSGHRFAFFVDPNGIMMELFEKEVYEG